MPHIPYSDAFSLEKENHEGSEHELDPSHEVFEGRFVCGAKFIALRLLREGGSSQS